MILSPRVGRGLSAALLAGCLGVAAAPAAAQLSPSQPIKIVVSAPAGGIGDLAARIVAQRLTDDGHPAIVENRVGGNGIVATDAIAKARPDGYTLIMGNHSTLAILPHMTKVGYDPAKDFVPVALMLAAPNVLVVKAELPVNSVRELIAYGKARRLTNASQGIGASGHLIGEQFRQLTGVDITHVHYRGAALAVQDVVAGHVDLMFDVVSLTREQVLSGQLRALAMLSSQRKPRAARCADGRRSRARGVGGRRLVRADGACRHVAPHRRLAQCADAQGVRGIGGERAADQAGAAAAAGDAGGLRRVDCR